MTLQEFQAMVEQHASLFRGVHNELPESLSAAESAIGFALPQSLRWLLVNWGYSSVSSIGSLADSVSTTLRCRVALGLPNRYFVLFDWGDAGVVLLECGTSEDAEEWPVHWMGCHNVHRLSSDEPVDSDCETFNGFSEWVASRLAAEIEENSASDDR